MDEAHVLLAHAKNRRLVLPVIQNVIFFLEEANLFHAIISFSFFLVITTLLVVPKGFAVVVESFVVIRNTLFPRILTSIFPHAERSGHWFLAGHPAVLGNWLRGVEAFGG